MSKLKSEFTNKTNLEAKFAAFQYQAEAFAAVKDLNYSAIFHEQGLGKTKIAIDLILYWLGNKEIDTAIIVTKKQLISNWQKEFQNHTFIHPGILSSDKKKNYYIFNSPVRIVVTNFETIISEKKRISLFLKTRDTAIVVDESAKLKNPTSSVAKVFFELSDLFKIKCIMTGTPVANRPYDIWSQIYFLDKGKSLGEDFNEFKKKTDLCNSLIHDNEARGIFEDSISEIFSKISNFAVRETKKTASINLPRKNIINIPCDFETKQKEIYDGIISEMKTEIKKNGRSYYDDDSVALKRLLRLNEVTSNPRLINDEYKTTSAKENELDSLLCEIVKRKEKCIVWSSFIDNIEFFSRKYKLYKPRKIHGSMPIADRNVSVKKFLEDDECKVLFATPQAAKEGLTLTVANNVIFYDRSFSLDDYLQAQDRIHRISQKKECNVYNLLIRDSIDIWIDKLLLAKQHAALLAQGDITIDQYRQDSDYSYGELIKEILESEGDRAYE